MKMSDELRPQLTDLNEHIVCPLCRGYLIDATTLAECLHSFCRGCIVRRLSNGARACPVCNVLTSPPLLPDTKLQRLVYLVVPGLLRAELERRRHFQLVNPQCSVLVTPVGAPDLTFDDLVSLSLEEIDQCDSYDNLKEPKTQGYFESPNMKRDIEINVPSKETQEEKNKEIRYLKCPAGVTVRHLQRLLMLKRGWNDSENSVSLNNQIELLYKTKNDDKLLQVLSPVWTLFDLACIFEWGRETPMKLLYRVIRNGENKTDSKSLPHSSTPNNENALQEIEDIQRPPTPPPSPKPNPHVNISSQLKEVRSRASNSTDTAKELEAKKPRCEVTPVLRTPGNSEQNSKQLPKIVKIEHHKRKKRKNKRVIAEITTTPRDMLKLKVRLTPCPPRVTSNQAKEKLLQMRAVRRDKIKPTPAYVKNESSHQSQSEKEEDSDDETIEQIIDSIPDNLIEMDDMNDDFDSIVDEANEKTLKVTRTVESRTDDKPKDEEVLRQLGLVNNQEMDREKLEKQLKESKANRVRSLLAEKQMRDTLETIKIISDTKSKDLPTSGNNPKKKGPPPLAPLRGGKASTSTLHTHSRVTTKSEIPLDLSNAGTKSNILDISSLPKITKNMSCSRPEFPRPATKSNINEQSLPSEKSKDDRKSHDSNLRTLSNAAVSLLGVGSVLEKSNEPRNPMPKVGNKVALRIPQPHSRISGFGVKMKPNLGIRHIPNPQAIVASQFRNQGVGYFPSSQRPS